MREFWSGRIAACGLAVLYAGMPMAPVMAAEISVGTAKVDITPTVPIVRAGRMSTVVSKTVLSPLTATALALEGSNGEQAIFISCDLAALRPTIPERLRELIAARLPDFDAGKLVVNTTHTHNAPALAVGRYIIPDGVVTPAEYIDFLLDKMAGAAVQAWKGRRPAGVSWGVGHAVVGHSRLAVYEDGSAQMYGKTDRADFSHFQGFEDHTVNVLFFWDRDKKLRAMAVDVGCPAQTLERQSEISADYWHDVRLLLRKEHSADLAVVGWCSAAGEISPHLLYDQRAETRMYRRRGLTETQEIARRIARAVADAFEVAKDDIHFDVPFVHRVAQLALPMREITDQQAAASRDTIEKLSKRFDALPRFSHEAGYLHRRIGREKTVVERYEQQKINPNLDLAIHVLRLGDVAIATNSFELFVDYGMRIKARSKALQTFLIQLTSASTIYLPPKRALQGGGYGAIITVSIVGPEGGQKLVDRSVELIHSLWADEKKKE